MSEQRVIDGQTWVRLNPPTKGYPIIMNSDHADYEAVHADLELRERADWPLPSFDARDWAEAFCKIHTDCSVPEGEMLTWFANALMRGYDERSAELDNER